MTDLITQISSTIGKSKVLELSKILKQENFDLRELIDLTFNADKDVAFRAAWILENILLQSPTLYEADLQHLISHVAEIEHASCQRHYAKILLHLTKPKTPAGVKAMLDTADLEPVVEKCFDWLIDPHVKIAVKCFSQEVLFNLRDRFPWIKAELAEQVKFLMRNGSPGIQSRGKKILERL